MVIVPAPSRAAGSLDAASAQPKSLRSASMHSCATANVAEHRGLKTAALAAVARPSLLETGRRARRSMAVRLQSFRAAERLSPLTSVETDAHRVGSPAMSPYAP